MSDPEKHPVKIENKNYTVVKLGDSYKHSLSNKEKARIQRSYQLKDPQSGSVVVAKPHTEKEGGMHVDLEDLQGNEIDKIRGDDFMGTFSTIISDSETLKIPYPNQAVIHRVGVFGDAPPGTISTTVKNGTLAVHPSEDGTIQVAFWEKDPGFDYL